jgi:hypothetical protein
VVAAVVGGPTQLLQGLGLQPVVAEPGGQLERPLLVGEGGRIVAQRDQDPAPGQARARLQGRVAGPPGGVDGPVEQALGVAVGVRPGDPLAAAAHVRRSLAPDGTFLLVEPAAGERVTDNLNPVGRIFYSASLFICVPSARSQGGEGLGSQVPEPTWRELLTRAGFGSGTWSSLPAVTA